MKFIAGGFDGEIFSEDLPSELLVDLLEQAGVLLDESPGFLLCQASFVCAFNKLRRLYFCSSGRSRGCDDWQSQK